MRRLTALAIWALGAGQSASQAPQQAEIARAIAAPDRPDPPPEPLSGAARAFLKQRMAAHAHAPACPMPRRRARHE